MTYVSNVVNSVTMYVPSSVKFHLVDENKSIEKTKKQTL